MLTTNQNIFNSIFPLTQNNVKGNILMPQKVYTDIPTKITKPCQIKLGNDYYLNSRSPLIERALREQEEITIGSDETCNIIVSEFYDDIAKKHIKISKENDALILTDLSEDGETEVIDENQIKPFYQGTKNINLGQENVGDCYLLSTIRALSQTDWGANFIKNMVQVDKDGNYIVTFKNQMPIIITQNDLNGEGEKRSVSSELGVKAIERAYAKLAKKSVNMRNMNYLNKGGLMDSALKLITGIDSKRYIPTDNILKEISEKGCDKFVLTCGTKTKTKYGDFTNKNKKFYAGHAYAINNIDAKNKTIELINPHNTKISQTVSWNEFKDNFDCMFVGEIPNQ